VCDFFSFVNMLMDPLGIFITVFVIYILICILVSLFIDADSTTFLYSKFGPAVSKQISGQVIWVVGAGRGLGASISVSAAARGARLVLTSRTKNDLEKVKTECLDAGRYKEMKSEDVLVLPFDVSNTLEHEKHVKKVIDKMGKISGIIHCVGDQHHDMWQNIKLDRDIEMFHKCVFGPVHLTRCILPHMMERNSGMIAVVNCVEAVLAAPFMSTIAGYKQALNGYFQSLKHEVMGCGISVSMLVCGPVDMQIPDRVTRQAYLCLVSICNNLTVSWMCRYPFLTIMYVHHYFPDMCSRLVGLLGPRIVSSMRSKYGATDAT